MSGLSGISHIIGDIVANGEINLKVSVFLQVHQVSQDVQSERYQPYYW